MANVHILIISSLDDSRDITACNIQDYIVYCCKNKFLKKVSYHSKYLRRYKVEVGFETTCTR